MLLQEKYIFGHGFSDLYRQLSFTMGLQIFLQKAQDITRSQSCGLFSYSFPSGFIVVFTVLFGYMAYLLLKKKDRLRKTIIIVLWICLMMTASVSRVYAGISYPSDVLAGFLLGGLWLAICIVATKALEYYR